MVYVKKGLIEVDEFPITIDVSGELFTVSDKFIQNADFTFNTTEDYYEWANINVSVPFRPTNED